MSTASTSSEAGAAEAAAESQNTPGTPLLGPMDGGNPTEYYIDGGSSGLLGEASTVDADHQRQQHKRSEQRGSPVLLGMLTAVAALGGLLFGYDTGVVSGALILIASDFGGLDSTKQEIIVSATIAAAIVGSILGGRLADYAGRRSVLLMGAVTFTGGAALMAFAQSFGVLVAGRTVVGVAIGAASMASPLYIAEVAPPSMRGRLVTINNLFITGGQFLASIVDGLFSSTPQGWRYMLGLGAVPAIVQGIGLLFLPDSPRYLANNGRMQQAAKVLSRVRGLPVRSAAIQEELARIRGAAGGGGGGGGQEYSAVPTDHGGVGQRVGGEGQDGGSAVDLESTTVVPVMPASVQEGERVGTTEASAAHRASFAVMAPGGGGLDGPTPAPQRQPPARPGTLGLLREALRRRGVRRALVLGCGLQLMQQLAGINTVMYYSATILEMAGVGNDSMAIWMAAAVAFANFAFTFLGVWLVERIGRRPLTLASLAGVVLALVGLGVAFLFVDSRDKAGGGQGLAGMAGWVALAALVLYLAFFAPGMGPMPWTINAEIYPLDVRAVCIGASSATNWVANFVVAMTFLSLVEALTPAITFFLYAGIGALGWLWLVVALPETRGLSLEAIEGVFAKRSAKGLCARGRA